MFERGHCRCANPFDIRDFNGLTLARVGIVSIYVDSLGDYRRGIVEAEKLLKDFPDQRQECASSVLKIGKGYAMLREFEKSREAFEKVIKEFGDLPESVKSARKGITWLNRGRKGE